MEFKNINYSVSDRIATVAVNRPKALNALNSETVSDLSNVFDLIINDDNVLGVVIVGAGGRAFVAGADIAELSQKNLLTGREFVLAGQAALNKIEDCPKPVIAAVNGFALGGGCELAMACHMRVASITAKFGQPEVGLGLIPGFGGTQRLPRLVGKGRAFELLLGGGIINAAEAYRIGLVNAVIEVYKKDEKGEELLDSKGRKVFDTDAFLQNTQAMLQGIVSKAPLALAYVIESVNRGCDDNIKSGLATEADLFSVLCGTEDMREGLIAFLDKREAKFTGK